MLVTRLAMISRSPRSAMRISAFDADAARQDFPILRRQVHGNPLVYLDNAATTQKPQAVIDRLARYYGEENANVHRGLHWLSERATAAYEDARAAIARFVNAPDPRDIVFVRGATEAINLVAQTYGRTHVGRGDEVVVSGMEHHSNIVPWQILCEEKGARLRIMPVTVTGELDLGACEAILNDRTRIVSVVHVSNALGTVNPVEEVVRRASSRGIPVLIDGAQAVAHMRVDVQRLGCAFYTFSGHKVFGPTGIGVLYGISSVLDAMPPYQGGGDMIRSVTFDQTTYADRPSRFEAGTPNVEGAVGLAAAISYLTHLDIDQVAAHERALLEYAIATLSRMPGLRVIGAPVEQAGIVSFVLEGVHPHDVGTMLDRHGVAIRAGNHCCQPLMERLGLPATVRASLALYNTRDDIDALVRALHAVRMRFQ
jgi:cysteine desulfurase / selenocysteine lyase